MIHVSGERLIFKKSTFLKDQSIKIGKNTVLEPGAIIYDNCEIDHHSIIGANSVIRPHSKIGNHTIIGPLVELDGRCEIGNYTTIQVHSQIPYFSKIGNCCFIASYFMASNTKDITKGKHGTAKDKIKPKIFKMIIEDYVRIGVDVKMIPGIKVGHHSFILQGCLITKNIPPYSKVKGGKDRIGKIVDK